MNSLVDIIQNEIARTGSISFARFMELALYAPGLGYYEKQKRIGRGGDYMTSVSVGSLFGELLAFQFAQWLELEFRIQDSGFRIQIVEAGAHDGQLAADILNALRSQRPEIFQNLEYWILEPSATQTNWQQKTLAEFKHKIRWFDSWEKLPGSGVNGIIFCNELLDAMPTERFGWNAAKKKWFEWRVGWNGQEFYWVKKETPNIEFPTSNLPINSELLKVLPDEFTMEKCPAAISWWKNAASHLGRGKLLTLDYGLSEEEFWQPQRSSGTLRAYFQHRLSADLLSHPGQQDLTAHVNFTALQKAGESQGLETEGLILQSKFLTQIAEQTWNEPETFDEWNSSRKKQLQTLTHPEHLGRAFRVLIQTRS
ncbi:MAG: SAM-dependent methyltransferase [Verrucomicrobiota bacterium]|nr:SAM-dependent methyltransferase [Verrucomicrobiota bacterium]